MLLSSLVIVLVASTFLVQNRYYASQVLQAGAQDNARAATELMASEIRSVMLDGIIVAGPRTLTVRSPIVLATVCQALANQSFVHSPGGQSAIDTVEVAGIAIRDTISGAWTYAQASFASFNGSDAGAQNRCASTGADTVGSYNEFHEFGSLPALLGTTPALGDVLMLFRETTFTVQTSTMDTTVQGLFRKTFWSTATELASGFDTSARFQYRTSAGTYVDTVTTANLDDIDVIRMIVDTRKPAPTGGVEDITSGWSVNIALRNVR